MTHYNPTGSGPDRDSHRPDDELTTTERFERFHEANPHVYDHLVRMARQWRSATGGRRLGIRTLWEATRWDIGLRTGDEDYKLNDHYPAFYVRLIIKREPDLADLFEL
ncbi:MAG: hypothetical protein ACRDJC_25480, partial [Thermomicrobiales bacterium]